ncbi:MAG: T9SS type A sorting domain-containing protein [Bacteroidales bacterium]
MPWSCLNGLFSTYPNPASNYLEIDIDNARADKLNLGLDREFSATIINTNGIVKYTDRLHGFPHRINTGNLINGVYIFNISYEGYSFSKRVMIDN